MKLVKRRCRAATAGGRRSFIADTTGNAAALEETLSSAWGGAFCLRPSRTTRQGSIPTEEEHTDEQAEPELDFGLES
jgi:hypothetical protein